MEELSRGEVVIKVNAMQVIYKLYKDQQTKSIKNNYEEL